MSWTDTPVMVLDFETTSADIHLQGNDGSTPLAMAAKWSNRKNVVGIARLLIEHGANTDGIDLSLMDDQEDDW